LLPFVYVTCISVKNEGINEILAGVWVGNFFFGVSVAYFIATFGRHYRTLQIPGLLQMRGVLCTARNLSLFQVLDNFNSVDGDFATLDVKRKPCEVLLPIIPKPFYGQKLNPGRGIVSKFFRTNPWCHFIFAAIP